MNGKTPKTFETRDISKFVAVAKAAAAIQDGRESVYIADVEKQFGSIYVAALYAWVLGPRSASGSTQG